MTPSDIEARIGLAQCSTPWTFEEDVHECAEASWTTVGVWLQKLERARMTEFWFPSERLESQVVERAAHAMREAGLATSHVVASGFYLDPAERERERRTEHTVFAIGAAEQLEAACLVIVPGRRGAMSPEEALDHTTRALGVALDETRGSEVRLAIEPIDRIDFMQSVDDAMDLVDLVGSPRLGVCVDVFHQWRDPNLLAAIARAGDRIFNVHIADSAAADDATRLLPGDGVVPLAEIVAAIEGTGYRGAYDLERFAWLADGFAPGDLDRAQVAMRGVLEASARVGAGQ